jgi:hypothetical protein
MAYTTINKGSSYFNTKLYTGTGATNSVTGVGFQPDWVWIKERSEARDHVLFDVVRAAGNALFSNLTNAEDVGVTSMLSSFNSDGFTVAGSSYTNANTQTYVAWNWLASNTSGSSNTAGSITSTVAANTTAGFSIVSYTGTGANATVGHGLGVAPDMIICKSRSQAQDWAVYNSSLGNTKAAFLNGTGGASTSSSYWNNTSPTSTVFTVGNSGDVNYNAGTQISYCFSSIKGYSKFGSYTGNGSADGTFIYTGFKPAFFLNIRTDTTASVRFMFDNKRNTFNVVNAELYANTDDSESNTNRMDFLSNGFKCRSTSGSLNASGGTYIYMAFAENPFVTSGGIPVTAR